MFIFKWFENDFLPTILFLTTRHYNFMQYFNILPV